MTAPFSRAKRQKTRFAQLLKNPQQDYEMLELFSVIRRNDEFKPKLALEQG